MLFENTIFSILKYKKQKKEKQFLVTKRVFYYYYYFILKNEKLFLKTIIKHTIIFSKF